MDSASALELTEFLSRSMSRMDQQEEQMKATGHAVQALVAQVSELTQQLQRLSVPAAPTTPPVPPTPIPPYHQPEPRMPTPEAYSGEPSFCRPFINKCSLFFSLQPQTFASEQSKVAFVLTLLTGRAAQWGTAVWENHHQCCTSFQALSEELRRVFDRAVTGREAARVLADLRQGNRPVSDYSIEFRTLAAECQWNEEAQWDMFLHGLADRIQREIYVLDLPRSLDGLIESALRVDARLNRLEQRTHQTPVFARFEGHSSPSGDMVSPVFHHEPMQVGGARLSREERQRRRTRGLCLYCGGTGHFLNNCPVKDQAR
uniref:CCHC-type domain-containing protein n=1 Tax=Hucho hucho TaxID=62062 RepID=A0A4W5KTI3_9TELE